MRAADKRQTADPGGGGGGADRKDAAKRARRLARKQAEAMPVVEAGGPSELRVVDAELVEPSPKGGILEVFQQRYLLRLIVSRELASRYAASLLGLLWSYIQPAMRFAVYYVVMGLILQFHKDMPYFPVHLFTGMVAVHYFGETWAGATRSIWANRQLVLKMRMPREIFPVASMVVAAYHTLPQVLVLVVICLALGWTTSWAAIGALLLGLAILIVFSGALALFFAALNVFYRDFQNIVGTILQFMHFMVPMMYGFERVRSAAANHPVLYELYMANPIAQAVLLLQRFFWYGLFDAGDRAAHPDQFPPDLYARGAITLAVSFLLLYLAQRFFSRSESTFPERM